jgi:hypothetical protein
MFALAGARVLSLPRVGAVIGAAILIASALLFTRFGTALATTPCSVYASTPTTDGTYARGTSQIDCPTYPLSEWVKGELVSLFGPFPTTQASCINYDHNSWLHGCNTVYNCNGSGTLEHFEKTNGRDRAGGESGWRESAHVNLTC